MTNLKIKLSAKESVIEELTFKNDLLTKRNKLLRMERGESLELEAALDAPQQEKEEEAAKERACQENDNVDLDKLIADLRVLSRRKTFSSADEQ